MGSTPLSTKLAMLFTQYLLFTMAMGATVTVVMVPMVVMVAINNSKIQAENSSGFNDSL
jgi:hypothetical protein